MVWLSSAVSVKDINSPFTSTLTHTHIKFNNTLYWLCASLGHATEIAGKVRIYSLREKNTSKFGRAKTIFIGSLFALASLSTGLTECIDSGTCIGHRPWLRFGSRHRPQLVSILNGHFWKPLAKQYYIRQCLLLILTPLSTLYMQILVLIKL